MSEWQRSKITPESEARHLAEGIARTVGSYLLKVDEVTLSPSHDRIGGGLSVDLGYPQHVTYMGTTSSPEQVARHLAVMLETARPDLKVTITTEAKATEQVNE